MPTVNLYPSKDVHIANHSYGYNYMYQAGKQTALRLGSWGFDNNPTTYYYAYQSRILLKFDLPTLPNNATVTSAKLKMYLVKDDHMGAWNKNIYTPNNNPTLQVHQLYQPWDEGMGDGVATNYQYTGATWVTRTADGYGWGSYGGYYNGAIAAQATAPWQDHWWEFDIKNLVQSWYASPSSNNGLLIKYMDDYSAQGAMLTASIQSGNLSMMPRLELTYNTPPEKPRGLVPSLGSFVCYDLSHTTHFKWNFIDVAAPVPRGKADFVFLIDVSNSMQWRLNQVRDEIGWFIDRLNASNIDWQIGLVAFSDVHLGEPLRKWGWFTNRSDVTSQFDRMPRLDGKDWPESGLDAIMDPVNGALSFAFRPNSATQFFISTDAPFHNRSGVDTYYANGSIYEFGDVINVLKSRGITTHLNTNTHCASYTQLHQMSIQTGGMYIEETVGWAPYLPIKVVMSEEESQKWNEGDIQSRADLRVWKINPNGTRTQIWTYTVNGPDQEIRTKGLNVPWEEGASYEWDVTCYDSNGVASPPSDKAKFTYIIDVNILVGIPMYNEPIVVGSTINKKALMEFRGKLYDEVRKYRDLDPNEVLKLFNGEVVPSREDMTRLRNLMNKMLIDEGLPIIADDLVSPLTFGVEDIEFIRKRLVEISYSAPDNPTGGKATRTLGMLHRPLSIIGTNASSTSTSVTVVWTPSEYTAGGWIAELNPALDTDINYYKFYHEQIINYNVLPKYMLTEVYLKSEQVLGGHIFIPDTGRVDSERMWYHAHDMNGRVSQVPALVQLQSTSTGSTTPTAIAYYIVECQQKAWGALHPDPAGTWYQVYKGTSTSFSYTLPGEGSYWYRVKAVDTTDLATDWTYTIDTTYVKY